MIKTEINRTKLGIRAILYLIVYFFTILIYSSCKEDDSSFLSVACSQLSFEYSGGSQTIRIDCDADWSVYGLPDWLTVSVFSGIKSQDVILTATSNFSGMDRESDLIIRTNDSKNKKAIRVIQYSNPEGQILEIDDLNERQLNGRTSLNYDEDSIIIHSTIRWSITGPSWLTCKFDNKVSPMNGELKEGSGTIYLNAGDNYYETARRDTIIIRSESGKITKKIPIVQLGYKDIKTHNMVILSDLVFFNLKYGSFVNYFSYRIFNETTSKLFQDSALLKPATIYSIGLRAEATNNMVVFSSGLKPDSDFDMYFVPQYKEDEFQDTLYHEKIHTPSAEGQPRAFIRDVVFKDGVWYYCVVMNQYAKGFYFSSFWGVNKNLSKAEIAYRLYHNIKNGSLSPYYTNKESHGLSYNDIILATWAIGFDDELSKVMDIYRASNTDQ